MQTKTTNHPLFLFALLLSLSITANAQTNVSGFINANTTWDLAGSPYIVVSNALLSHGYTLTIDPGVVVKFNDSTALQIDGELHAIGTPQNRITFTSNQPVPAAGDWAEIHFADACVDAVLDSLGNYISGCIMKFCDVTYGGGVGLGMIHNEMSTPYLSNCNVLNSASYGINWNGGVPLIDPSAIKNSFEAGLTFNLNGTHAIILRGDTFENNMQGGIVGGPLPHCYIANNYFIGNMNNGAINIAAPSSDFIIANNFFINNSSSSGIIYFNYSIHKDTIACNTFVGNHASMGCINFGYLGEGVIANNIFMNNSGDYSVAYIYCSHYDEDHLFFIDNYVSNNTGYISNCFFLPHFVTGPNLHINHNSFVNNNGRNVLTLYNQNVGISSFNFLEMKFSNFINPNCLHEINDTIPYGSPNVNADSNYWGTLNTQHIDSLICDYFDFANQSVVYYQPILSGPVELDTSCFIFHTGINETSLFPTHSTIFPNPFSNHTTIRLGKEILGGSLRVYNLMGEQVRREENISGSEIPFNQGNLGSGIYFYEVREKGLRVGSGKAVVY